MFRHGKVLSILALFCAFAIGAIGMRLWQSDGDIAWALGGRAVPKEFTGYYAERREFLLRQIRHLPNDVAIFLGDSRFDSLNVSAVIPGAANLGIGGETSERLRVRILDYQPYSRWSLVVICVGFNDTKFRTPAEAMSNVKSAVELIAGRSRVVLVGTLPADETVSALKPNNYISELNSRMKLYAETTEAVEFLDASAELVAGETLLPSVHIGDGIHLNHDGQKVFIRNLRRLLSGET
jgi:lysophospholipase L1-like esterase